MIYGDPKYHLIICSQICHVTADLTLHLSFFQVDPKMCFLFYGSDVNRKRTSCLVRQKYTELRKHDSAAADLERVTDHMEEKEISSSHLEMAAPVIGDRRSREQKTEQAREK